MGEIKVKQEPSGVLNINKPAGITSHDVVDAVRKILAMRKIGHTGTLDPIATGVLPLCVGRATKIAQYLTQADKEYLITMRLGVTTDTLDADGKVLSQVEDFTVEQKKLQEIMQGFVGEIQQIPPLFSAKKVGGVRLYKLARQGGEVERKPITVKVYELQLLSYEPPFVRFFVRCSKGTYARALCDDIGRALGCGAHLVSLVRTKSGPFDIKDALTLDQLKEQTRQGRLYETLISMDEALSYLPAIRVLPEMTRAILHGAFIPASAVVSFPPGLTKGEVVRVLGYKKKLLSLAKIRLPSEEFEGIDPRKIILTSIRVFSNL
ncbi:MAG: tRNA pseudouridine(55) synthase TruB [candidate division NC10 bacterium]|nr:tRNA pseudouridine(55) synthase TruB [candidate division NC10 bacterium]